MKQTLESLLRFSASCLNERPVGRQVQPDPAPTVATIKDTLKFHPYTPGGFGTSIGTLLEGNTPAGKGTRFWSDHSNSGDAFPTKHLAAIFAGADSRHTSKTAPEIGLVFVAKRHRNIDQRNVRLDQHLGRNFETCGFDQL